MRSIGWAMPYLAGVLEHQRCAEQGAGNDEAEECSLPGYVPGSFGKLLRREQIHDTDRGTCTSSRLDTE